MSGPKTSSVTLAQQAMEEARRRAEERARREALLRQKRQEYRKEIMNASTQAVELLSMFNVLADKGESDGFESRLYRDRMAKLVRQLERDRSVPDGIEAIDAASAALKKEIGEARQAADRIIGEYRKNYDAYAEEKHLNSIFSHGQSDGGRKIAGFSNDGIVALEKRFKETELAGRAGVLCDKLRRLSLSDAIRDDDRDRIEEIYAELTAGDGNGNGFIPEERLKYYETVADAALENAEVFDRRYDEYCELYAEYIDLLREGGEDRELVYMREDEFESLSVLIDTAESLRHAIDRQLRLNYIRKNLAQVMAEYGFDVESNVVLFKTGTDIIYSSMSGDTGVHVQIAGDGAGETVMMEITGIRRTGSRDSFPDGKTAAVTRASDLSAGEREKYYEEQVRFCAMHKEITEKLREKGIEIEEQYYMPPSLNCSKVITYCMADDIEKAGDDRRLITDRKRERRSFNRNKKALYKEMELRS